MHRLPQVLREFKIRYPQVDLDLQFMDSEDACSAIAANRLELAIVTLPEVEDDRLICETVWIDELVVVTAPDHELAANSVIEAGELLRHAAILPSHETFTRRIIDSLFADNGRQLEIILETNYLETIKVMVSANLGWSILPRSMVDTALVEHRLAGLDAHRRLGMVTRRHRSLSPGSSAMQELLRELATARSRPTATRPGHATA